MSNTIRLCGAVLHGQTALLQAIEVIEGEEHQFVTLDINPDTDNGSEYHRSYSLKGCVRRMNSDNTLIEFTADLPLTRDSEGWRIADMYTIVEIERNTQRRNPPKERYLVWWDYGFRGNPVISMKVKAPTVRAICVNNYPVKDTPHDGYVGTNSYDRQAEPVTIESKRPFFRE